MASKFLINLSSLNVNGTKNKAKRDRVIEWIKCQNSSICFLQETHFDEKIETEIRNNSEFNIFCSHGTTSSRGVAILIKKSLNYKLINKHNDVDGRLVLLNVEIDKKCFTLMCIYAPNCKSNRNIFFKKVNNTLKEQGIGITIMGGDFNDTMKAIDRKKYSCRGKSVSNQSTV